MFLRRTTKNLQNQNWFAVGLDFCIVVLGVFMGLQVQEWAENRATHVEARAYHQRLANEYTQLSSYVSASAESYDTILTRARAFSMVALSEEDVAPEIMAQKFVDTFSFSSEITNPGVLDEMISAGKMGLVYDDQLRSDLLSSRSKLTLLNTTLEDLRNSVYQTFQIISSCSDYEIPKFNPAKPIANQGRLAGLDAACLRSNPDLQSKLVDWLVRLENVRLVYHQEDQYFADLSGRLNSYANEK